ncbi:MAG: ABC transporter permease [Spirochaetales bacterium]|nr:ABC transporter permease [Spirochaetales bacterium]
MEIVRKVQALNWRFTFILDGVFFILLLQAGFGIMVSLFLVEAVFWLLRLTWLSPVLLRFILTRLVHMIPIIVSVLAIGFLLIQMAPGDIFTKMLLEPNIRPQDIETFRRQFALDQPWYVQFFLYIFRAFQGNFGFSIQYRVPVFTLVSLRAWNTIILSVTALVFSWGLSIPMGIIAATKQYKWQDQTISVFAFIGLAIPNFFLAFLLQFLLTRLAPGAWPIAGMRSLDHESLSAIGQFFDIAKHMVLPVFVLGTSGMASLTRIMRANMLDILNQQYIVTARAKGLSDRVVIYRHALRNAINPMITILGFQIAAIMSGAALTEVVLSWPGLGNLILTAILQQDLYLVIGSLLYSSILLVVGNLIADILLAIVDPRVRIS